MPDTRKLSKVNAVLFDLDGTILDSNGLIAESWRHTSVALTGRVLSDDDIYSTFGEILLESMKRLLPEADAEKGRDFYRDYQRSIYLDRIKLFDGTEEVVRKLRAAGFKTAIVTSRLKPSTYVALDHFRVTGLFDVIITASDTEKFKPDPAPVLMTLDLLGSEPEEAFFIGDTNHDLEAGQAAGVTTALVNWSVALPPEKRTGDPAPDFVIESLLDIPKLLGV